MKDQLLITDTRLGDGKAVVKGALITTHYTGKLDDGTVFDSSHKRGKPFQCVIGSGRVIKGWEHGVRMLPSRFSIKVWVPDAKGNQLCSVQYR